MHSLIISWGENGRADAPMLCVNEFARLLRSSSLPKKMRGNLYVQLHLVQVRLPLSLALLSFDS